MNEHANLFETLAKIEREKDVEILYACESGSRAYGTHADDSDYDVRLIFKRRTSAYLRVTPPADCFETKDGPFDVCGWDVRKAAGLLYKSNPSLLEWIHSPIVYAAPRRWDIVGRMRELARQHFSPISAAHSYLSTARNAWTRYVEPADRVRPKEYLTVFRALASAIYVAQTMQPPSVVFDDLIEWVHVSDHFKVEAINMKLLKRHLAADTMDRMPDCDRLITSHLAIVGDRIKMLPKSQNNDPADVDAFCYSAIAHGHPVIYFTEPRKFPA